MASKAGHLVQLPALSWQRWSSTSVALADVAGGNKTSRGRRISALFATDSVITSTLDEWDKAGRPIRKLELITAMTQLRKLKKYDRAIQLFDWMDKSPMKKRNSDRAIRITLLSKVKGLGEAESYFNSLEENAKTKRTYGALLSCYAEMKMVEKASSLAEKMRETNTLSCALNYNTLMGLYMKNGQPEKIPSLVKEMEEKNVPADIYTYNQLINSHGSTRNFEEMERVLNKIKSSGIKPGWFTYTNLANIYVKSGLPDKARLALEKLQRMKSLHDREAFHIVMKLQAQISNKAGVFWAWESLRITHPVLSNGSYLVFLSSLSKLGEIEGVEKYFKEWESRCSFYDVRLLNVAVGSYLNVGMIDEAKGLLGRLKEREIEPSMKTWSLFMNYHLKKNEMEMALSYLEAGLSKANPEKCSWFIDEESESLFESYFEKTGNAEASEKLQEFVKNARRGDGKSEAEEEPREVEQS